MLAFCASLVRSHNVSSGTNKGFRGTGTGNVIFVAAKTRTLVSLRLLYSGKLRFCRLLDQIGFRSRLRLIMVLPQQVSRASGRAIASPHPPGNHAIAAQVRWIEVPDFAARGDTLIGPWSDGEKAKVLHPLREFMAEAHTHCPRTRRRFIHSTDLSELLTMSASKRWRDRAATFVWRMATSPFSIGVYIAIAIWISFLVNAETGIPAYLLMAAQFLLVIFVDPPKRVAQYRERRYGRPARSPNSRTAARVKQHR
jgi:hypothetical protein